MVWQTKLILASFPRILYGIPNLFHASPSALSTRRSTTKWSCRANDSKSSKSRGFKRGKCASDPTQIDKASILAQPCCLHFHSYKRLGIIQGGHIEVQCQGYSLSFYILQCSGKSTVYTWTGSFLWMALKWALMVSKRLWTFTNDRDQNHLASYLLTDLLTSLKLTVDLQANTVQISFRQWSLQMSILAFSKQVWRTAVIAAFSLLNAWHGQRDLNALCKAKLTWMLLNYFITKNISL